MGNNLDTLFLDRFVDALSRMCRATPPRDACAAWIDTDSDELQCWVGLHADLPDWSQCIVLIDAAIVWASTPVEGRAYGQHGNYVHATIESLRAQLAEVTRERDEARADDAKLGAAVRAVLDMFMWDHSTVRAEVESDRLAETVEGCIFVAIERAIRPADFVPAHAKASGGDS